MTLASGSLATTVGELILRLDAGLAVALHDRATPQVTEAARLVTLLGSTPALLAVTAGGVCCLVGFGRRRDALLLAVAFAGAQLTSAGLKAAFRRDRPSFDEPVATADWFSYPSGHAVASTAVYGALAWILASALGRPRSRVACFGGAAVLVGAIGFSRLYLGVHYLSDVVAGYCAGVAWLLVAAEVVRVAERCGIHRRLIRGLPPRIVRATSLVLLLVLASGCASGDDAGEAPPLPQQDEPVTLDATNFVAQVDNPYWPMKPGTRWVFRGSGGKHVVVTVTERRKKIRDIDATVVHAVEAQDGEVVETTYDWFAQDRWGNVWYLGEDTTEYENGRVTSTEGSWEHGVDGAQAGIVMPAEPAVGLRFRQEYYDGEAEDRAEIVRLDAQATVPAGSYDQLVMTKDTTPLEPKVVEHKYYAKGVGPVLAVGVRTGSREELVRFER
jgi:membrane-associated phospholipid phosphatase